MELQDFVKKFAEQLDDTDISEVQADTVFQDLEEWSSLTAMGIIAFVKTGYGKILTGKGIRSCETVKDLFDFVQSL
ncbi:acyl carrier protein [Bacteroidia bacterium]|nr:acyl carrier protein [Bacteroidia bacterium]